MVTGTVNPSVLGSALSDLVLRVRGTNHNGQLLRLRSPKCTIGSGPNCTLRLRGRGISQIHCLILRGPNATVIRRWSPDTRLNGRSFTEAQLSAGDRLNIGSLEFEIVATGEIADSSPGADGFFPDQYQQYPTQSEPPKDLQLESDQLDARRLRIQQEEEILDERSKQLENAAAALRAEQNKLDDERRQWENLRRRFAFGPVAANSSGRMRNNSRKSKPNGPNSSPSAKPGLYSNNNGGPNRNSRSKNSRTQTGN